MKVIVSKTDERNPLGRKRILASDLSSDHGKLTTLIESSLLAKRVADPQPFLAIPVSLGLLTATITKAVATSDTGYSAVRYQAMSLFSLVVR